MLNMETSRDVGQLLAEGKRLLESGDKAGALEQFKAATDLAPSNESAWLWRAKATDDPAEAVESLEHVLSINPENVQAREQIIYLQMHGLQQGVRGTTNTTPIVEPRRFNFSPREWLQNRWVRIGIPLGIIFACGAACILLVASNNILSLVSRDGSEDIAALPFNTLPPVWTKTPTRTPTRTPSPSPTPSAKAKVSLTVRAGPNTNYPRLGTLPQDSIMTIIGRSSDSRYVGIAYPPDGDKTGWVSSELVDFGPTDIKGLPVITPPPTVAPPPRQAIAVPTAKATNTPAIQVDYVLGRPVEFVTDCNQPWKVAGTVYSNQSGQRVTGVQVRVTAFGQVQATLTSGYVDSLKPGYWEWVFGSRSDVQGEIAIIGSDSSPHSQPVSYRLTAKCEGTGAATQVIIDFVGVR